MAKSLQKTTHWMIRIAVTGPESTGKTSLAKQLAAYFDVCWVEEYARSYLMERNGVYQVVDLDAIAKGQLELWGEKDGEKLCFYDTEMLVMKIWSEFKYHQLSSFIQQAYQEQQIDLFLVCKPDIDWEEDELREHPELRQDLFAIYIAELQQLPTPFEIVYSQNEERINLAINKVINFLVENNQIEILPYDSSYKLSLLHLLELNTPHYFAPEEKADFEAYLEQFVEDYSIVKVGNKVVGCGGVNYAENGRLGKLSWAIIHPDFQGKGIGTHLLKYRVKKLKSVKQVEQIVVRTSQLVYQFYEKNGFQLKEIVENYWAEGLDMYYMELK
ncbi:MAG: GNAT family N-acetyltransferase [Crocinitomicaceae bacterium]|nr:GNAT family N-acetyltransferase [Crocinitomicaceae bacterium]